MWTSEDNILFLLRLILQEFDQYQRFQLLDSNQNLKRSRGINSCAVCISFCLTSLTSCTFNRSQKKLFWLFTNIVILYIFLDRREEEEKSPEYFSDLICSQFPLEYIPFICSTHKPHEQNLSTYLYFNKMSSLQWPFCPTWVKLWEIYWSSIVHIK